MKILSFLASLTMVFAASAPVDANIGIHGRVLDEGGKPVEGALIEASPVQGRVMIMPIRYVKTNEAGEFVVDGLETETYYVCAMKKEDGYPNLCNRFYSAGVTEAPVALAQELASAPMTIVKIGPKAAEIQGELTEGSTGAPIAGGVKVWRLDDPNNWSSFGIPSQFKVLVPAGIAVGMKFSARGCIDWKYSGPSKFQPGAKIHLPVSLSRDPASNLTELSRSDDVLGAVSESGPVQVQMRELRAAKPEAPGSGRQMSMLLFFEPSSGLFSWDASETEEADEGAPKRLRAFKDGGFVVLRQGHLITFVLEQSPPRLRITDRQTHAADLDQAQEMALYTADGFRGPGGELTIDDRAQHIVSLAHMTTFLNDPTGGTQAPRITDADRDDQRWKLTISGPWKERIVLDALYNLVTIYKLK